MSVKYFRYPLVHGKKPWVGGEGFLSEGLLGWLCLFPQQVTELDCREPSPLLCFTYPCLEPLPASPARSDLSARLHR